jgi:hypothetical protein
MNIGVVGCGFSVGDPVLANEGMGIEEPSVDEGMGVEEGGIETDKE